MLHMIGMFMYIQVSIKMYFVWESPREFPVKPLAYCVAHPDLCGCMHNDFTLIMDSPAMHVMAYLLLTLSESGHYICIVNTLWLYKLFYMIHPLPLCNWAMHYIARTILVDTSSVAWSHP